MMRKKLTSTSFKKAVIIPSLSVFVGCGYLQHGCSEWKAFQILKYHMYFIPSDVLLKATVQFAYGFSRTVEATKVTD